MKSQTKDTKKLSDEEIIQLYLDRNENAIKETDIKYRDYLISIANNIVHDLRDSEECLNDTYLKTWNSIPPTIPASLIAFLVTIIRRTAVNCYKKNNRQKRVSSELTISLSDVEDFISDSHYERNEEDLGKIFSEFVSSLSKRKMYIFMSRYYLSRSIKDIAELLDCSESTINKEINAIKKELKEILEKDGYLP